VALDAETQHKLELIREEFHALHRRHDVQEATMEAMTEQLERLTTRIYGNGSAGLLSEVLLLQHTLADLQQWRQHLEPLRLALAQSQEQGRAAVQVAQVQGLSARSVALLSLCSAALAALITGLLLWWAAPKPPPHPEPPPQTQPGRR
jgi:hypothetical protein